MAEPAPVTTAPGTVSELIATSDGGPESPSLFHHHQESHSSSSTTNNSGAMEACFKAFDKDRFEVK